MSPALSMPLYYGKSQYVNDTNMIQYTPDDDPDSTVDGYHPGKSLDHLELGPNHHHMLLNAYPHPATSSGYKQRSASAIPYVTCPPPRTPTPETGPLTTFKPDESSVVQESPWHAIHKPDTVSPGYDRNKQVPRKFLTPLGSFTGEC